MSETPTSPSHSRWWLVSRTPLYFAAAALASLIAIAIIGITSFQSLNDAHTTLLLERVGSSSVAFADTNHDALSATFSAEDRVMTLSASRESLEPGRGWNHLVDTLSQTNNGASNVFVYESSTGSFDRIASSFRNPEGNRVNPGVVEPGLIREGHPAFQDLVNLDIYKGPVPVGETTRVASLIPITSPDGQLAGALAVDIGLEEDLARLGSVGRTSSLLLILLAVLLTLAVLIALMVWSSRPLFLLTCVAQSLGSDDARDSELEENRLVIDKLRKREDAIGKLASSLDEMAELQGSLESRVHTDSLTGIANRAALMEELADRFETAQPFAMLIIDLDGFKRVNDGLGHQAGDELLIAVAKNIESATLPTEFVARLGGDEFAVLTSPAVADAESAHGLARRISDASAGDYQTHAGEARVTTSTGIALVPEHGKTIKEVVRSADLALYEVKRTERGTSLVYEPRLSATFDRQLRLLPLLRRALEHNELDLAYQPIYNADGTMAAVEALCRWTSAEEGIIDPEEFIPIAESAGLIVELGDWVLRTACAQYAHWAEVLPDLPSLSVNVSSAQLRRPVFVQQIASLLEAYPAVRGNLALELTETLGIPDHTDWHRPVLAQLSELGVIISIDDFGTGYSSLSYLHDLKADVVKVDKSFVSAAAKDPDHAELLRGIVALGKGLGLWVILEGIETEAELAMLRSFPFDGLQGYLFARPMPAPELVRYFGHIHPLLATNHAAAA